MSKADDHLPRTRSEGAPHYDIVPYLDEKGYDHIIDKALELAEHQSRSSDVLVAGMRWVLDEAGEEAMSRCRFTINVQESNSFLPDRCVSDDERLYYVYDGRDPAAGAEGSTYKVVLAYRQDEEGRPRCEVDAICEITADGKLYHYVLDMHVWKTSEDIQKVHDILSAGGAADKFVWMLSDSSCTHPYGLKAEWVVAQVEEDASLIALAQDLLDFVSFDMRWDYPDREMVLTCRDDDLLGCCISFEDGLYKLARWLPAIEGHSWDEDDMGEDDEGTEEEHAPPEEDEEEDVMQDFHKVIYRTADKEKIVKIARALWDHYPSHRKKEPTWSIPLSSRTFVHKVTYDGPIVLYGMDLQEKTEEALTKAERAELQEVERILRLVGERRYKSWA